MSMLHNVEHNELYSLPTTVQGVKYRMAEHWVGWERQGIFGYITGLTDIGHLVSLPFCEQNIAYALYS